MIAPCDRCGRDGADYIYPTFCLCKFCDAQEYTREVILGHWVPDDEAYTDPGCPHIDEYDTVNVAGTWDVYCVDCGKRLRMDVPAPGQYPRALP